MSLFQHTILKKHTAAQSEKIASAYALFSAYFLNPEIQENIRNSKEEQFQEGFLRELFVKVLGYTLRPEPNYNLETEKKNEADSKKADGAILVNGEVVGVIELKDHKTTDLKSVEGQAFGYKNNNRKASYVVISNFEKLRFYIDNAIDFIEFNLFSLSKDDFALLWLCLAYENIAKNLPKQLKIESVSSEDQITKKFYKDYSAFKRDLFADLTANNPHHDRLTLFKKSQKLLDRLLFILFAEDGALLPANSIRQIVEQWEKLREMDEYRPLYDRLKKYFGYLDVGHGNIFAYNGGLFKPDEVLDGVRVSDEVLGRHLVPLSEYDFASEVDVNILGHIFENSLTEIEEITSEIEGRGEAPKVGKRKKDGVFYTPRYITTYIVENTLGKLCSEKKTELEIEESEYFADRRRQKATTRRLDERLQEYRRWLLALTICDPACGSGAFLNAALDFLINEHHLIDEMTAKILGHAIAFPDIENAILENNLYGVDINEESVEIARLALWLRTAKPHRKLNSLSDNIKCGNSLISDPAVAGDKAFDWQREFPHVFERGGFDVVIGNPPYVHLESVKDVSENLSGQGYKTYDKRGDLYPLFVERGFTISRDGGYVSFIMPNKWMQAGYGKSLREFFLTKRLVQIVDFGDIQIFEGATTYSCIFIAQKKESDTETLFKVSVLSSLTNTDFNFAIKQSEAVFDASQFSDDAWVISSPKEKQLLERLRKENISLGQFINGQSYRGVLTGLSETFLISQQTKEQIISEDQKAVEIIKPIIRGRDIAPWFSGVIEGYLIGTFPALNLDIGDYPSVNNHLLSFGKERLEQSGRKGSRKKTNNKWFETQDAIGYYEEFAKPKIMYQAFQVKPCFIYDEQGLFCNNSMWFIPTDNNKALLTILNSKMGWWLISKYCTQIQNGYQLIWKYFGQIPIPAKLPVELGSYADKMLSLNADLLAKRARFCKRLADNLVGIRITGVLERFDELNFKQFLAELKKQKIALTLRQQDEWEEYFNDLRTTCQTLTPPKSPPPITKSTGWCITFMA